MTLLLASAAPRAPAVFGAGNDSCSTWAKHAKDREQAAETARVEGRAQIKAGGDGTDALIALMDKKAAYTADRAWLEGFLTGIARQRASAPRRLDVDSIYASVTSYCTDHPRASVAEAASRLVNARRNR